MDTTDLARAINALAPFSIQIRDTGDWYVLQTSVEIKNGTILRGVCGCGETPQRALANHWEELVDLKPDERIILHATNPKKRRSVVWNGFMWRDLGEL